MKSYDLEFWKDVIGWEGFYQISNIGRVKSLRTGRIMKPRNVDGYRKIHLQVNGKFVNTSIHRLIAIHFIPNPLNKAEVNHIDGNKSNNVINNLEWVTKSENCLHCNRTGLRISKKLGDAPKAKPTLQFNLNGDFVRRFSCLSEVTILYGFDKAFVARCCLGQNKTAYGFLWKYENSNTSNKIAS